MTPSCTQGINADRPTDPVSKTNVSPSVIGNAIKSAYIAVSPACTRRHCGRLANAGGISSAAASGGSASGGDWLMIASKYVTLANGAFPTILLHYNGADRQNQ